MSFYGLISLIRCIHVIKWIRVIMHIESEEMRDKTGIPEMFIGAFPKLRNMVRVLKLRLVRVGS